MPGKTNAARILDAAGVPYEIREYQVDENDLSAPHVAEAIGMPPEQVFKTLVARGDRRGPAGRIPGQRRTRPEGARRRQRQ